MAVTGTRLRLAGPAGVGLRSFGEHGRHQRLERNDHAGYGNVVQLGNVRVAGGYGSLGCGQEPPVYVVMLVFEPDEILVFVDGTVYGLPVGRIGQFRPACQEAEAAATSAGDRRLVHRLLQVNVWSRSAVCCGCCGVRLPDRRRRETR